MRDYQTKANQGALPDSNTATKYGAGEVNSLRTEAKNAVSRAGLTLAPQDGTGEDTTQLAQSLFINGVGAGAFQDNGSVNVLTLTPLTGANGLLLPPNYDFLDGAEVSFFVAFDNTGAATLSLGQTIGTQIGAKALVREDGSALVGGEMTTTVLSRARYDLGNDRFVLTGGAFQGGTSVRGIIGQVLQHVETEVIGQTSSNIFSDVPGFSLAITPQSTASKILVRADIAASNSVEFGLNLFKFQRDGVDIGVGTNVTGNRTPITFMNGENHPIVGGGNISATGMYFLDEPNVDVEITYTVQWQQLNLQGAGYINRSSTDPEFFGRTISTFTLMEVLSDA